MKTVNEVSKLTGVSIRTLQYYDKIGLLKPAEYTESGYRLYDDAVLERLQQILQHLIQVNQTNTLSAQKNGGAILRNIRNSKRRTVSGQRAKKKV